MTLPIIQAEWPLVVWAALMLVAALGFWADRTRIGRAVSGAAVILAVSMALSNLGVLPRDAPAYGVVWSYLVPLAIPLLLFKADLRRVLRETGSMLPAFALGATGTLVGALLGFHLLPLGDQGAQLAGVFSATYIGGTMNMVAVTQAVGLEASMAAAAVAADNVVGVVYLALLALAPSMALLRRFYGGRIGIPDDVADASVDEEQAAAGHRFEPAHAALALGLSFAVCAAGEALAALAGVPSFAILFITALALLLANLFPRRMQALQGDYAIGLFFMYVFFAAIGAGADLVALLDRALLVALYAAVIVVCHAVFIFLGSRLLRVDLVEVTIASNACAAGPASAAALAASRGRGDLVAPAVLLGVFGYAVANFLGIGLASYLVG